MLRLGGGAHSGHSPYFTCYEPKKAVRAAHRAKRGQNPLIVSIRRNTFTESHVVTKL
jgi:hypothetical protein